MTNTASMFSGNAAPPVLRFTAVTCAALPQSNISTFMTVTITTTRQFCCRSGA